MKQQWKRGDLVEVIWEDSCSVVGWQSLGELETFAKDDGLYRSFGYVYGVRKKRLILVGSISNYKHSEQRVCQGFAIPMSAIRKWRELR